MSVEKGEQPLSEPEKETKQELEKTSEQPELKFSKEQMKDIIQDVIDRRFIIFNLETMADYDADFSEEEPLFLNIRSKKKRHGFGYIIFHHFLREVGIGRTFLSTDFTEEGEKLFKKAKYDGLIEKISDKPIGLHRLSRWKVLGDPVVNLEKLKNKYE